MSLGIRQSSSAKTWTKVLLEESEFSLKAKKKSREHTFRRMYMTVFVLFGSAILVISSLFYVGAFIDVGKVVGVSQADRVERSKLEMTSGNKSFGLGPLESLKDLFNVDRVYMRAGQTIVATFDIPKGSEITLIIKQCQNRPIIEVFDCQLIGEQSKKITSKNKGFFRFSVSKPGFYHFGQSVRKRNGQQLEAGSEYRIIWQRG
ncbi:MAG: hypothetical protein EX271_03380 [Acidimicrobiales bacterium]|nr:hypothetical protein [Hyphomonadaceae bacterium]RZV43697.1 MAG: hypothetical protein EX271_03380 [Acidimicrobiales bacterium]